MTDHAASPPESYARIGPDGPSSGQVLKPILGAYPVLLRPHLMEYVIIFMLFFAVLAAAWFYLMRAKARTPVDSGVAHDAPSENH